MATQMTSNTRIRRNRDSSPELSTWDIMVSRLNGIRFTGADQHYLDQRLDDPFGDEVQDWED